jgi:GNAT superfamily N-acetyltransferase
VRNAIGRMSGQITVRDITDPRDPAIDDFGRLQRAVYFAPETLIPAQFIPRLLGDTGQSGARRNFLLVAELDGRFVGGTLFHWLPEPRVGFSSFLGVDHALRGRGIARRLHEERFAVLDRAAGDRAAGLFIDVVNPTRMPPEELKRESKVGSDPWARRRAFAHLGFRQVDVRYEQPVGGPDGGPVTDLDLLYCPREPADSVPTQLVVATLRAYWSPWLGVSMARRHARELEARAEGRQALALIAPEV